MARARIPIILGIFGFKQCGASGTLEAPPVMLRSVVFRWTVNRLDAPAGLETQEIFRRKPVVRPGDQSLVFGDPASPLAREHYLWRFRTQRYPIPAVVRPKF